MFKKVYSHPGGSAYCPECRESISREANICPHCRTNLKENEAWQAQKNTGAVGCSALLLASATVIGTLGAAGYHWLG